jgi:hypothetical protein
MAAASVKATLQLVRSLTRLCGKKDRQSTSIVAPDTAADLEWVQVIIERVNH